MWVFLHCVIIDLPPSNELTLGLCCLQGKERLASDPDSYFSQQKYEGVYSSIYILLPLLLVAYLVSFSIVIAQRL